jgi:hypothetical protein
MRVPSLVAAALLLTMPARADDATALAVVSYGSIPAGASFQTELADNNELTNNVDSSVKAALGDRGFHFSPDAGFVISITADKTGSGASASIGQQANAQVNIQVDTSQNPLLGGGTQPTAQIGRAYRITLAIYDRSTGRYVWRGQITDSRPGVDPASATDPMVDKLVSALENSVAP